MRKTNYQLLYLQRNELLRKINDPDHTISMSTLLGIVNYLEYQLDHAERCGLFQFPDIDEGEILPIPNL